MTSPKIQALGMTQAWFGTTWKAKGYVEGVGWLEARGKSLLEAMEMLQALAAMRVTKRSDGSPDKPLVD